MRLNMGNRIKDVNKKVAKLREAREKVQQEMILERALADGEIDAVKLWKPDNFLVNGNEVKKVSTLRDITRTSDDMPSETKVSTEREYFIAALDELNELTDKSLEKLGIEAFQHETLEALEDGQYPLEAWTTEKVDDEWQVVPDENKVIKMNDEVAKFSRKRDKVRKDGKVTIEQMILQGRWNGMAIDDRRPIKNLSVGDEVKTKTLLSKKLVQKSPLMDRVKTWVVASIESKSIPFKKGKKSVMRKRVLLILRSKTKAKEGRRKGKHYQTRTFWIEN